MSAAGTTSMSQRRAELFEELAAVVSDTLAQLGVDARLAEQAGNAAADALAESWGGQVISVPKNYAYKLAQRDFDVLAALDAGESIASVAARLRMHIRSVYRIVQRAALRDGSRGHPGPS